MKITWRETETGCWEVTSHKTNKDGYPVFNFNGKKMSAHRAVYLQANPGQNPEVVRHKCDNRKCINLSHLLPGTHVNNAEDRFVRGRSARGERGGNSKLKAAHVIEILRQHSLPHTVLAEMFGVDPTTIRRIRSGAVWRHIARPDLKDTPKRKWQRSRKA